MTVQGYLKTLFSATSSITPLSLASGTGPRTLASSSASISRSPAPLSRFHHSLYSLHHPKQFDKFLKKPEQHTDKSLFDNKRTWQSLPRHPVPRWLCRPLQCFYLFLIRYSDQSEQHALHCLQHCLAPQSNDGLAHPSDLYSDSIKKHPIGPTIDSLFQIKSMQSIVEGQTGPIYKQWKAGPACCVWHSRPSLNRTWFQTAPDGQNEFSWWERNNAIKLNLLVINIFIRVSFRVTMADVGLVVRKLGLGNRKHSSQVETRAYEFLRRCVVKLGHNALGQVCIWSWWWNRLCLSLAVYLVQWLARNVMLSCSAQGE